MGGPEGTVDFALAMTFGTTFQNISAGKQSASTGSKVNTGIRPRGESPKSIPMSFNPGTTRSLYPMFRPSLPPQIPQQRQKQ
ncbi:hypothetical protein TWF718_004390 [Orbilia javanica]|uniref:Uncharacterized protein n=1 Tax=Orbilia javanica TaxID=47235 RepID=A0AAN8REZ3_9PEZI